MPLAPACFLLLQNLTQAVHVCGHHDPSYGAIKPLLAMRTRDRPR